MLADGAALGGDSPYTEVSLVEIDKMRYIFDDGLQRRPSSQEI
jgi:hypothetical protein